MNRLPLRVLLFTVTVCNLCAALPLWAGVFIVTHTGDNGAGSFRQAILDANTSAGPDTIRFHIPAGDAGHDPSAGTWTIEPASALPEILDRGTYIDGFSQNAFSGEDTNPAGPEIVTRSGSSYAASGLILKRGANACRISGLVIHGFTYENLLVAADSCRIDGCYLGLHADGQTADTAHSSSKGISITGEDNTIGGDSSTDGNIISGNGTFGIKLLGGSRNTISNNCIGLNADCTSAVSNPNGISLSSGSSHNTIGPYNIIAGNTYSGIDINHADSDSNSVIANFIGTNPAGDSGIGNGEHGIRIEQSCGNTVGGDPASGNTIAGNGRNGMLIADNASDNTVSYNRIGTDPDGETPLGNGWHGIDIHSGPSRNQIGPGNVIRDNGQHGIRLQDETTLHNRITENSIFRNQMQAIAVYGGANDSLEAPVLTGTAPLQGTAGPYQLIEIFSDSSNQARVFEDSVRCDASGNFSWNGTPSLSFMTVTATDQYGNTSGLSDSISVATGIQQRDTSIPQQFTLAQNYPNPFNPATTIAFTVADPCRVCLRLFDIRGRLIRTLVDRSMQYGSYDVTLRVNGLPSGTYIYQIRMGEFEAARKMVILE